MSKVLITDRKNSEIAAEVPYLFKKAGCTVDVFCSKDSWLLKNKFWDKHIPSQGFSDREYVVRLEKLAIEQSYDFVVIADDITLDIVNSYLENDQSALKILPISKIENRGIISSKAGLHLLCEKYGIGIPRAAIYNPSSNIQEILSVVSFPLLLKVDKSGGGKGVFFCKNENDVRLRLKLLTDKEKQNLLFQKYIYGDNISVEAFFKQGKLLAYAYSVVSQNIEGEFSVSFVRRYEECKALEKTLEDIGAKLGINGFSSITFLLDKTKGKYYLVEADLRPQVWFSLARFAGVDFSLAISNCLSGNDFLIRPSFPEGQNSLVVRHFSRSIIYALKHFDMIEMVRWVFNVEYRSQFIPTYDLKFLRATVVQIIKVQMWRVYNMRYLSFIRTVQHKLKPNLKYGTS